MTTFQIKKGLSANITKATPIEGCWYVTTDTHRIYVCLDGKTIQPLEALSAETLKRLDDFETDINTLNRKGQHCIYCCRRKCHVPLGKY